MTAVNRFKDGRFENGLFLGPLASLVFKGPYQLKGRQLSFDVVDADIGEGRSSPLSL